MLLLLSLEYLPSELGKNKKNNSPKWTAVLKIKAKGNLLPLPTGINDGNKAIGHFPSEHLYYQSIHEHRIIGGYISRIHDELRDKFQSNDIMDYILSLSEGKVAKKKFKKSQIASFIADYEVKYIVVKNSDKELRHFISNQFLPTVPMQQEVINEWTLYSIL